MKTAICIFEDEKYVNFLPLVYTRPVYDLRCGISTLREKISFYFSSSKVLLHSRKYLTKCLTERNNSCEVNNFNEDSILFINGRLIIDKRSASQIKKLKENSMLLSEDGSIVAANVVGKHSIDMLSSKNDFIDFACLSIADKTTGQFLLANYPWGLVNLNGDEITNDFRNVVKKTPRFEMKKYPSVEFKNKKDIFIGKNVSIDPFVFLDASLGPIYIGKNAHIMSHCYIQGPASIGEESVIKSHAAIYHNTSIGKLSKVGGEVEASIIHSYSNKQHEGFLGHSYLGSWVNIGASTNNSDLKNNYADVSVMLNGKPVDTGSQFVGLIMGDHSKTAINTMFNTGSIVGVSCNIFGAGFPDRYIPSFSWGGPDFLRTYDLKKSTDVARLVMQRRDIILTEAEEKLLCNIFEMTLEERIRKIKK